MSCNGELNRRNAIVLLRTCQFTLSYTHIADIYCYKNEIIYLIY